MKKCVKVIILFLVLQICTAPFVVHGEDVIVPPLTIREIKITGDEFVVLQATTNIPDLSEYWVGYTASETVNPGSIVPSQQLPQRALQLGQALLMTSDGGATCDAVLLSKLSASLGDTKGTFVVRRLQSTGMNSTFTTVDAISWAKPSVTGSTTATLDLRKETTSMASPVWYHDPSQTKPWRIGNLVNCMLTLAPITSGQQPDTVEWAPGAIEPPAVIESLNDYSTNDGSATDSTTNIGLAAPIVTEMLPNPAGTGTDASDEYIELYNSNDVAYDLSGFTLQTGLTTKHSFVLPNGTTIAPKSFRQFNALQTGLSMSNTAGQVSLLDTSGAVVIQSDPYDAAPDGQAWALANGVWYWTTKPTPAATNVIAQPIALPAAAAKKLTVKTAAATAKVKSASTKKTVANKTSSAKAKTTTNEPAPVVATTSVHPGVLATIACAALGYGAYVYRKDLANALYKLRRH